MIPFKCLRYRMQSIETWILVLYIVLTIDSIYNVDGLSSSNERGERKLFGGYRITPKFCKASKTLPKSDPRSHGPTICMFNHECSQRQGEVVGACMDGFLFGACCQLSGSAESLIDDDYNKPLINPIEPLFNGGDNRVTINNGYGGSDTILIEGTSTEKGNIYLSSNAPGQVFSPELPTHMVGSYETTNKPTTTFISVTNKNKGTKTSTARPKPTTSKYSTDKYVLVQTLSNNNKIEVSPKPQGITDNEIESIESIILMLNDTKTGPQYNTGTRPGPHTTYDYTNDLTNTAVNGNYYITTKLPSSTARPSTFSPTTKRPTFVTFSNTNSVTSSIYSPAATASSIATIFEKIPTLSYNGVSSSTSTKTPATSYVYSTNRPKRPSTTTLNNRISSTTSKKPLKIATQKKPIQKVTSRPVSTSYVNGPTPERPTYLTTKRPSYTASGSLRPHVSTDAPIINNIPTSTPAPTVIVLGPYGIGGSATDHPSPTIHITPKPTVNYVSSSTSWTNRPELIKFTAPPKPNSPQYVLSPILTKRPGFNEPSIYTSLGTYGTTPSLNAQSIFNDVVDDPGYYGVSSTTPYPLIANIQQTVTSASIYAVVDDNSLPLGPTTQHDDSNFPPVRNPNLNGTSQLGVTIEDYDISTPQFVEDELLDDKMSLLVSKIVESLKDNFHELADVIENKTITTQKPTKQRPGTTIGTKKPPQRATTKRPPSGTTITRPSRPVTTTRPIRRTTKKPTTILTTKRPVTKLTTTTRRPTTKVTRKPITTTLYGVQEQTDDGDVEADEFAEEEEEDVGEETNEEESTPFFESGRVHCGVRPHVKQGRIVGGKSATFGEWPWQVLVRESTWLGLFNKIKCGGVLISKSYVVTAAHCQPGFLATLVAVFGEFDTSGDLEKKRSVTKNIKRIVVHRDYDAATFLNDLALLELESPIHYDTHIVPICMPSDGADFTGRMASVTGWGRLKYGGGIPTVLQEVQVPIIENTVCQEMFHTSGHSKKILPSFLCAGYANGQKDSCEGDSGGPLVLQRPDGRWELAGTVSHGIKCAAPYLPGVYMRTTYYKPWLESVIGISDNKH